MAPKVSSIIQYVLLGALGYILAGAPLSRFLFGSLSERSHQEELSFEKSESLVIPEQNLSCPHHAYNIHLFSKEPLVIYIESFLSDEEAEHLVRIR